MRFSSSQEESNDLQRCGKFNKRKVEESSLADSDWSLADAKQSEVA